MAEKEREVSFNQGALWCTRMAITFFSQKNKQKIIKNSMAVALPVLGHEVMYEKNAFEALLVLLYILRVSIFEQSLKQIIFSPLFSAIFH